MTNRAKKANIFVWAAFLALVALLAFHLLPYQPPWARIFSTERGNAFRPLVGEYLQYVLYDAEHPLKATLQAETLQAEIRHGVVRIAIGKDEETERTLMLTLAPKSESASPFDIRYSETFTKAEREAIENAFAAPMKDAEKWMSEKTKHAMLFHRYPLSDIYMHFVMLLLASVLLYLFLFAWRKRLTLEDWPLALLIALGAINIFLLTTPNIGDLKLHFYNESYMSYDFNLYGPLNFAFQKMLYRLFPMASGTLFFANALLGLLTAIPLYLFTKEKLGGKAIALFAALVMLTHPIWLRYAQSDLTHSLSLFLFFAALAIMSKKEKPTIKEATAAIVALALCMLGRAEFMAFLPAGLLLLGFTRLKEMFARPISILPGFFLALWLTMPQAFALLSLVGKESEGIVTLDISAMIQAWAFLGGKNTYALFEFSPPVHFLMTIAGFALLFVKRFPFALALLASTMLFLWNSYIFQPVFSSTHYQLPVYPAYFIAAGFAFASGFRRIKKLIENNRARIAILATLVCIFLLQSIAPYGNILRGEFLFMEHYRKLQANKAKLPKGCALAYVRQEEDTDIHNPEQVWFDREAPFLAIFNLAKAPIDDFGACVVYLKSAGCEALRKDANAPTDINATECEKAEASLQLTPIWEDSILAIEACGESYRNDTAPIGLYCARRFGDCATSHQ